MFLRLAGSFALLFVSSVYPSSMPKLLYRSSGITLKDGTQQALQNALSTGLKPSAKEGITMGKVLATARALPLRECVVPLTDLKVESKADFQIRRIEPGNWALDRGAVKTPAVKSCYH